MSKVLVDRAALEEAAKWLEIHSSSSGSAEAFAADALREAIAQPAEAEGVEAVEFWVLFDATTPEPYIKKMMPEGFLAFFDHEEDAIRAKSFHPGTDYKRVPYVRQSDHLAALSAVTAERDRLRKAAEPLEPVHGDELPPIGSKVLIHLASCDEWIEHTVAGYYAWGDLDGYEHLHRVFVRVRDSDGYLNARLLKDVRPVGAAMSAKEG